MLVLLLQACGRLEKSIVGTWTTPDQMTEFDFRSNGTGLIRNIVVSPFTYTIKGDRISFIHTGPIAQLSDAIGITDASYEIRVKLHGDNKLEFLDGSGMVLYKKENAFDIDEALK